MTRRFGGVKSIGAIRKQWHRPVAEVIFIIFLHLFISFLLFLLAILGIYTQKYFGRKFLFKLFSNFILQKARIKRYHLLLLKLSVIIFFLNHRFFQIIFTTVLSVKTLAYDQ